MDYIIFGMGAGASLVLSGWILREMGPRIRDRNPGPDDMFSASELVVRMAWARFCGACGMALLTCGLTVLTVTGIMIFLAPDDETGALGVLVAFGLCGLMMLMWTALYLRQFGALGILRPKPKPETPPAIEPAPLTAAAAPVPVATAEPSIEQAASARGGFGRFASFLRRDASGTPRSPGPDMRDAPAPGTPASPVAPAEPGPGRPVPVDVAAPGGGDEKRLRLDDPLVTSVPLPSRRHLEGEVPEPASEPAGTGDDAAAPADVQAEAGDSTTEPDAVSTLRERRLRRMAEEPHRS